MNTTLKLMFASLICAGTIANAVHEPYVVHESDMFNLTNTYGKDLHVKLLNPDGTIVEEPIPVRSGDNFSKAEIPTVVFAYYPDIKDSGCGLFFNQELKDKLKDKCVYLIAKPTREKVRFLRLRKKENNICSESLNDAKKAYKDWVKEMEKKGIMIEAVEITTVKTPVGEMVEVETAAMPAME